MPEPSYGVCQVCESEPAIGVASVPGVPISMAYGRKCLEANAHPYEIVVINTAMLGGLDQAAPWWDQLVTDTLEHLEIPRSTFDSDVAGAVARIEADEKELQERAEQKGSQQ